MIRSKNNPDEDEVELEFDSDYGLNNQTFVVVLNKELAKEKNITLILSMDFVSQITDTLQGVYKTSYANVQTGREE